MSTIIPAQDNVDIEPVDDKIVISQSICGGHYESVTFLRVHLSTIIRALEAIRDEPAKPNEIREEQSI